MVKNVRLVAGVATALLIATVMVSCDDSTGPSSLTYGAVLLGTGEPVPTGSTATGTATFIDNTTSFDYVLSISPMNAVTAAHIHLGPPGCVCPVIINLFTPNRTTLAVSGVIATGTITQALNNQVSVDSLRVLFNNGQAYVNVHTTAFGGGEIRGVVTRTN